MGRLLVVVSAFCCLSFYGCQKNGPIKTNNYDSSLEKALAQTRDSGNAYTVWQQVNDGPDFKKGYFDPHTHNSGVLPFFAFADLNKYIAKQREYYDPRKMRALFDFIKQRVRANPVNPRYSLGSMVALNCLNPDSDGLSSTQKSQEIAKALEIILSSTPWSSFDSAHAFRGGPIEEYLDQFQFDICKARGLTAGASCTQFMLAYAMVQQMSLSNQSYSEVSVNFTGGAKQTRLDTIKFIQEAVVGLNQPSIDPEIYGAPSRILREAERVPVVVAKVLLMTHTSEFAQNNGDNNSYLSYAGDYDGTGKCEKVGGVLKTILNPDALSSISQALIENETVIGLDTASPESTCFTEQGMANYEKLAETIYLAAKERRKNFPGKLVLHTHVGEGATVMKYQNISTELEKKVRDGLALSSVEKNKLCGIKNSFAEAVKNKSTGEPVHYQHARDNLSFMLGAIKNVRTKIPDFDSYVVVRLGHVTHATPEHIKQIIAQNISVDINLTSNISTGSLFSASETNVNTQTQCLLETSQDAHRLLGFLRNTLGLPLLTIFKEHSFYNMVRAGVPVILGTDGGGIEHSTIAGEHQLARDILLEMGISEGERRQLINALHETSIRHIENVMSNDPVSWNTRGPK